MIRNIVHHLTHFKGHIILDQTSVHIIGDQRPVFGGSHPQYGGFLLKTQLIWLLVEIPAVVTPTPDQHLGGFQSWQIRGGILRVDADRRIAVSFSGGYFLSSLDFNIKYR